MPSPFDDPEFRAQMAKMGVAHQPGMAADLMRELAPLLKADGVDLDELGDTDIATLDAAMGRAIERRNLELMTPIGAQRTGAIATLRVFTAAMSEGNEKIARAILDTVEPDPADDSPAVSHVIGVSLGLLDDWFTDQILSATLRAVTVPRWHRKQSRAAASDLLPLARKGRSFDAHDSLIRRHNGLHVFEGAALVVAATLLAVAAAEGQPLDEVADRMLGSAPAERDAPRTALPTESAFRRPEARPGPSIDLADRRMLKDFRAWLRGSGIRGDELQEEVGLVEAMLSSFRMIDLELSDPADFDGILDVLFASAEQNDAEDAEEVLLGQLSTLHSYVHFRQEDDLSDAWSEAHDLIEDALDELTPVPNPFEKPLLEAEQIPQAERLAVYLRLPIVSAVRTLLEWIGTGRPVTPSGAVRRADIATVASMIGIEAVGVARVMDSVGLDGPQHVQSMHDLAELRAWWGALLTCDLIELSATRVRPGSTAADWLADAEPSFEAAEKLIGMFLHEVVNPGVDARRCEIASSDALMRELIVALDPEGAEAFGVDDEYDFMKAIAVGRMRWLAPLGLVTEMSDGSFVVPAELRGVVARGLLTAMAVMASMEELGDFDDFEE